MKVKKIIFLPVKGGDSIVFDSVSECLEKTHLSNWKFYDAFEGGSPVFLKINGSDEKKAFYVDEDI